MLKNSAFCFLAGKRGRQPDANACRHHSLSASLNLGYAENGRRKQMADILRSDFNQRGRATQPKVISAKNTLAYVGLKRQEFLIGIRTLKIPIAM